MPAKYLLALVFLLSLASKSVAIEDIDRLVKQEMQANQIPGLAVAILIEGELLFEQSYGLANVELDVPVTSDSVFELASLTKQFTAAAVLILASEGNLSLDDSIADYVDDAPAHWSDISIRQLLSHTAGLSDRFEETLDGRMIMDHSADDMIRSAMATPLISKPGEKWSYSDQGYALLGQVIERASGQAYQEFVEKRLLDPAGLDGARFHSKQSIVPNRVAGYVLSDGKLENVRRDWQYGILSHYGVMASIEDLAAWEKAVVENTVLSQEQLDLAWQPHSQLFATDGFSMNYGFGWFVAKIGDFTVVEHTGVTGTSYARVLESNTAVIVLSNLAFHDVSALGRRILHFLEPAIPFPKDAL